METSEWRWASHSEPGTAHGTVCFYFLSVFAKREAMVACQGALGEELRGVRPKPLSIGDGSEFFSDRRVTWNLNQSAGVPLLVAEPTRITFDMTSFAAVRSGELEPWVSKQGQENTDTPAAPKVDVLFPLDFALAAFLEQHSSYLPPPDTSSRGDGKPPALWCEHANSEVAMQLVRGALLANQCTVLFKGSPKSDSEASSFLRRSAETTALFLSKPAKSHFVEQGTPKFSECTLLLLLAQAALLNDANVVKPSDFFFTQSQRSQMQVKNLTTLYSKGDGLREADLVAQGHESGMVRKKIRHLNRGALEDEGHHKEVTLGKAAAEPWEWGAFLMPSMKYTELDGTYIDLEVVYLYVFVCVFWLSLFVRLCFRLCKNLDMSGF